MNVQRESHKLDGADGHLVDLISAALVDPNLHTDARLRLHAELAGVIERARQDLPGATGMETPLMPRQPQEGDLEEVVAARVLAELLSAVLVDPNLHTDTRLRLHAEIPELIRAAHQGAVAP